MRDKVGGGYPNYVDADGDGYPDSVDVSKRLAFFFSAFPDHYETFRPKLNGPFDPVKLETRLPPTFVANDRYKNEPGAMLREGNINRFAGAGSHCVDDVLIFATGPGSEAVHGFMENTEVFRTIANVLSLGSH
jgi:alkaline phosphatase